jgi:hypothetical protein
MRTETDPAGPFRFQPVGPFLLRDYSNDDLDDLKRLRGLLEEIQTQHKMLIPGQLPRLIRQWEADLSKAIEARSGNDEDERQTERAAS